jgi:hypothetical protein
MVRDGGVRVEEDARNEQIPLQGKIFVFSIPVLSFGLGLGRFPLVRRHRICEV